MRISITNKADRVNYPELYAEAELLGNELRVQHASTPFADVDALSSWMHTTWKNPRIDIRTDDAGRVIRIGYGSKKFHRDSREYGELVILMINCI
ncbi:MAG TPA: hypothetical protein PLB89_05335 [Flavobacteriales bacterium]|nr:hypothetical protein [Flavobacteriales bacterium]